MHYARGERWETFQERLELEMVCVSKECLDGAERLTWTDLDVSLTALDQWIKIIGAALLKMRAAKFRMVEA